MGSAPNFGGEGPSPPQIIWGVYNSVHYQLETSLLGNCAHIIMAHFPCWVITRKGNCSFLSECAQFPFRARAVSFFGRSQFPFWRGNRPFLAPAIAHAAEKRRIMHRAHSIRSPLPAARLIDVAVGLFRADVPCVAPLRPLRI